MLPVTDLQAQFDRIDEHWSPVAVARVNDQLVKVAKLLGEFTWHRHEHEDELFYVVRGQLVIRYEHEEVHLKEGELHVVPKGRLHNPVAEQECWVMLVEPASTRHTGDVVTERTKPIERQLADGGLD